MWLIPEEFGLREVTGDVLKTRLGVSARGWRRFKGEYIQGGHTLRIHFYRPYRMIFPIWQRDADLSRMATRRHQWLGV